MFPHKFVKTDPSDSIQNYRIVVHPCTVLDVTNANLFEHYLNVLFMNLTINYIYSPSAVLSVEWCGPRIDNKSLASIFHLSLFTPVINITIVTHSGLFVIHIASFVLKIPYLIPAICHQQLIRGWLIIQPSHAWLEPVPSKKKERRLLMVFMMKKPIGGQV